MASKKTPVPDTWWNDIDNVKQPPQAHAIYWYLMCGGTRNLSGIYIHSLDEIHWKSNVPLEDVYALVAGNQIRRVRYDEQRRTVFVMDRFEWLRNRGGNPDLNARSIMADHRETGAAKELWESFRHEHAEFIGSNLQLSAYFADVDGGAIEFTPLSVVGQGGDADLQRLLLRYTTGLQDPDRTEVLRAYDHVARHARTNRPLAMSSRLEMLQLWSSVDLEHVVHGCREWNGEVRKGGNRPMRLLQLMNAARRRKELRAHDTGH